MRQVLHPVVPVDLDDGDKALQDLVRLQARKDHPGRRAEIRGQNRGRQHDEKDENRVVLKDKRDVAARLHEAEQAGRLIAGADDRDRDHVDELARILDRGRARVVHADERVAQQEHRDARKHADAEENDLRRARILADLIDAPRADRLARDDADGAREAVHRDIHHVVQHAGDARRRDDARVEAAEDHRLPHHVDRPHDLPADDRHAVAQKVARQAAVAFEQILKPQAELAVDQADVNDHDRRLHDAGDQRRDRGAGDAERREAELAEDQHIVQRDVDDQRDARDEQADLRGLHRAHRGDQDLRNAEKQVGKADDAHVRRAHFNDRRVARKDPHDLRREQKRHERDQNADQHREPHADRRDFPDAAGVALSPVLGGQNQDRALDAGDEHLQHRLQLVSDVYAGNRAVAERADHQVIGKIHGEGHRVLQRDRDGEPHKRLVKIPVSRKEHVFHFLLNTTAPNCVFGLIIMNPAANVNIRRRLKKVCGARAARIPAKRKIKRKKRLPAGVPRWKPFACSSLGIVRRDLAHVARSTGRRRVVRRRRRGGFRILRAALRIAALRRR